MSGTQHHSRVTPPTPVTNKSPRVVLQRHCACGKRSIGEGECDECRAKGGSLRRALLSGVESLRDHLAPPVVHSTLGTAGRPLDNRTRAFFEPRFGHDFSRVRVHTDGLAGESARATNARAYTVG